MGIYDASGGVFLMKLSKIAQGVVGLYLILPGPEDALTGGATLAPSAVIGAALLLNAFGVKM
jgi:hypothetical protein